MTKYLEIKITLPLPESWAEQVKMAGRLAPAQETFKAALEKLGVTATMTERTYTPKPRSTGAVISTLKLLDDPELPLDAA